MAIVLNVNGKRRTAKPAADEPLLYVLRGDFGLNGPKYGCGLGQCGACTVLIDNDALRSCVVPAAALQGRAITTLESDDPTVARLRAAFLAEQAGQCAYCIPGMIMTAAGLLKATPHPPEAKIREALVGNLCRCGSHNRIVRAVQRAAGAPP